MTIRVVSAAAAAKYRIDGVLREDGDKGEDGHRQAARQVNLQRFGGQASKKAAASTDEPNASMATGAGRARCDKRKPMPAVAHTMAMAKRAVEAEEKPVGVRKVRSTTTLV